MCATFYVRLLIDPAWFFSNVFSWSCNFIASFHSNPLRNGTILLLLLGQESLDPESLVRRHGEDRPQPHIDYGSFKKILIFDSLVVAYGLRGCGVWA